MAPKRGRPPKVKSQSPNNFEPLPTSMQDSLVDDSEEEEEDDDEFGYKRPTNKRSRTERSNQAQTVSNVAQQLEEYARRAADDHAPRLGRPPKKGSMSNSPKFMDTMHYHALTYDDECASEDEENPPRLSAMPSSSRPQSAALSPMSSRSFTYATPASSARQLVIKLPSSLPAQSIPTPTVDTTLQSPAVSDPEVSSRIATKVPIIAPSKSAALAAFCLNTPPASAVDGPAITELLKQDTNLAEEFEEYRAALSPRTNLASSERVSAPVGEDDVATSLSPSASDVDSDNGSEESVSSLKSDAPAGTASYKDFTPFVVNHLSDTFKKGYEVQGGFTPVEVRAVESTIKLWFKAAQEAQ